MTHKISIISRDETGWHIKQIQAAAKARGVESEAVNISAVKDLRGQIEELGDVIIWRASSLDHLSERASILPFIKNKIFINETIFKYPLVAYKFFQQNKIKSESAVSKYAMATHRAANQAQLDKLIRNDDLRYPFIAKPNKGAMGIGVELIEAKTDSEKLFKGVSMKDYIFQNFIQNDGDWRIIILGGRPLGAMKRIAKKGSHLNNISQGATSKKEDDPDTLNSIYNIAVKVASIFNLRFCGVDIIRDKLTGQYYVLEVNTAPQWDGEFGFQSTIQVDVAKELVDYSVMMAESKTKPLPNLVEAYYKRNIVYDFPATFHFASRLWLWRKDEWARQQLDRLKNDYMGQSNADIDAKLSDILGRSGGGIIVNEKKKYRRPYIERYRMVPSYVAILFKVIFMESVYGIDIRPNVAKIIKDEDFISLFNELVNDHDAIRVLSTHAINYFYLLKNYFKNKVNLSTLVLLDPYELIDIANSYTHHIKNGELKDIEAIKLKIYLLTHAILGQSAFYQKQVNHSGYRDIVKEIEKTIYDNYFKITLDNKLEFLVCADLCGYKTKLKKIVLEEAVLSKSWAGNFIEDTLNENADETHSLRVSEHRNILYLMASEPFIKKKYVNNSNSDNKHRIGRLARISLEEIGQNRLIARVDTGATSSSIHCSDVVEKDGLLSFKVLDDNHPSWLDKQITVSDYKKTVVKNPSQGSQERFSVLLTVDYDGRKRAVYFTLADRKTMLYPVLLGRNFLHNDYIVDVDRQFISEQKK